MQMVKILQAILLYQYGIFSQRSQFVCPGHIYEIQGIHNNTYKL
jgi:hypothetical protein